MSERKSYACSRGCGPLELLKQWRHDGIILYKEEDSPNVGNSWRRWSTNLKDDEGRAEVDVLGSQASYLIHSCMFSIHNFST